MKFGQLLQDFKAVDVLDLVAAKGQGLQVGIFGNGGETLVSELVVQQVELKQARNLGEVIQGLELVVVKGKIEKLLVFFKFFFQFRGECFKMTLV